MGLLLLVPVVLLVLLPAVLGLHRGVLTDGTMGHSMGRGSVVLSQAVPPGDLRVGDVITFVPPHQAGHSSVTHRIVSLHGDVAVTKGDAASAPDPWRLVLDQPTYARVLVHVPWIGYPFVVDGGLGLLLGAAALALLLAVATLGRRRLRLRPARVRSRVSTPPRLPVA